LSTAPPTLVDHLDRAARHAGAGLRFLDREERPSFLSWAEIRRRARRVAGGLRRAGVRPGDRLVLVFPTGPGFFDAFFGTLLAGAVPVPVYPPARLGRLEEYHHRTARMLAVVRCRLVLADRRVRRILGESVSAAAPPLGCRTLDEIGDGPYMAVPLRPGDLGLVQFSSGTTVDPKPVALSHRAILDQAILLNGFWPDGDGVHHSGVSWLPLYHDMGLIGCVVPALERPAVLTLIPPELFVARPGIWLRAISSCRATISPAPNFAYGLCVRKVRDEELDGVDLSCWRVALNGAETIAPAVLKEFADRFGRWGFRPEAMTPVYGMSEAALAVTFSDLSRPPRVLRFDRDSLASAQRVVESADGVEMVSVGRPLPGFALRLVDDRGLPVPDGNVGRIRVQGPTLMEGYLDQPELTHGAMPDGWLDTGDLGFVWNGELFISGRAKDMLLVRGRNFPPEEVEFAAEAVVGVRPGCTVAVSWLPEGADGEELRVLVEAGRDVPARDYARIADECHRAVLAATGLDAERVVVLLPGTLPRTSSGKLRRQEALRQHLAGKLRPPKPVNMFRIAGALARSALAFARGR